MQELKITATASESERHLSDITTVICSGDKVFSAGEDGKVKIWNADLKLLREFQAHPSVVYHLAIIGNTIYTCSNDGTVKAWDIETRELKKVLLEYDDEVWRFFVADGKLYTGDITGVVSSWENDCIKLMYNLVEEVRDLIVIGNTLYTVRDRDVVITELTGDKGRYVTRATLEGSSPMCVVGNKLCFASRTARDVHVHQNSKENNFKEITRFEAHDMILNALVASGESTMFSGSWDKSVKRWDMDTFSCTGRAEVGVAVSSLAVAADGQVYAAGSNGVLVRIHDK